MTQLTQFTKEEVMTELGISDTTFRKYVAFPAIASGYNPDEKLLDVTAVEAMKFELLKADKKKYCAYLENQVESLNDTVTSLNEEIKLLESENDSLNSALCGASDDADELEKKYSDLLKKHDDVMNDRIELAKKLSDEEDKNIKLLKNNKELESKFFDYAQALASAEERLSKFKKFIGNIYIKRK